MELSLAQIEQAAGVPFTAAGRSSANYRDQRVTGWSIDSRSIQPGDLFFALLGEHLDGHTFVPYALNEREAAAAVVSHPVRAATGLLLQVTDVVATMGRIAAFARASSSLPLIAVTGSAGKTSTKEIIASLLATRFRVGKTIGNLNNHLGLPLTLLRLPADAEVAVVELGMNHAGEIAALAAIAKPQVAVVTNVGYAHVEAFDSIDGIALAKRELIDALTPADTAILNADDERVRDFRQHHRGLTITYGLNEQADVRAMQIASDTNGSSFSVDGVPFRTTLPGEHSISNILAGLAVAKVFGIAPHELRTAVGSLTPGKMRGTRRTLRGITVLDDSYNSNPEAARTMIDVLVREPASRKIAVMGEMLELGDWSERLHRQVGSYAAERGVDMVLGIGGAARFLADEAAASGVHEALFFDDAAAAGAYLARTTKPGDAVLFKGSRGTHVERALAAMENQ